MLEIYSPDLGLGFKIAQDFPNLVVGLGCLNKSEFDGASCLIENGSIFNASIVRGNLFEMELSHYDLIFYSVSTFYLLCTYGIMDFLKKIKKQVRHYCFFEMPMKGDPLCIHQNNLKCLQSPHLFRSYLCQSGLKVDRCMFINYEQHNFKRYLFICSI